MQSPLSPIDQYFFNKPEPTKSCLAFLRRFIVQQDVHITEVLKYGMPFYCFNGKMFCYLWTNKDDLSPYLGIVEGKLFDDADLISGKRSRMKIWPIDPSKDVQVEKLQQILDRLIAHYVAR